MKRLGLLGVVLIIILSIIAIKGCDKLTTTMDDTSKKYKHYVGTEVVIKKDTFVIVNYSTLDETFILDDGSKIAFSFVDKTTEDE
jgi:hypothetical protein